MKKLACLLLILALLCGVTALADAPVVELNKDTLKSYPIKRFESSWTDEDGKTYTYAELNYASFPEGEPVVFSVTYNGSPYECEALMSWDWEQTLQEWKKTDQVNADGEILVVQMVEDWLLKEDVTFEGHFWKPLGDTDPGHVLTMVYLFYGKDFEPFVKALNYTDYEKGSEMLVEITEAENPLANCTIRVDGDGNIWLKEKK